MYLIEFLTIAIAHLFAVASPGPDFAVVMRQCLVYGTRTGVWTALGVGSAILLHVSYCLLGVALLLSQSDGLFNGVKLVGACYLLFLGVQSLRASFSPKADQGEDAQSSSELDTSGTALRAFTIGFLTNGLNPKATLFFLALFTVVISADTPTSIQVMYGLYLALATFVWFSLLSVFVGRPSVRQRILKAGNWIDRLMGLILILLALQIAFSFAG